MNEYAVMPLDDYKDMAEKIREKTQTNDSIKSGDVPQKIESVFEAGKEAEHVRVWNEFQQNGTRTNYPYGFCGSYWNDETYDPVYPILCTNSATYFFAYNTQCTTTKVPITIDTENAQYVFYNCSRLKTIPLLTVTEKTAFTGWFISTNNLENLNIQGTIAKSGFDVKNCQKLSRESIVKIINILSESTSGLTVTLSKIAVNKAFETSNGANDGSTSAEWLQLKQIKPNWTIYLN